MQSDPAITRLIQDWQRGDESAERTLFDLLYKRLHQLALSCLRSERAGNSLGPTALVHEAYLRFNAGAELQIVDRNHFLALAARVMRRIVVDHARARRTAKRGGDEVQVEMQDNLVSRQQDADTILAVDRALDQLSATAPRQARIVELRYFAGYSIDEAAAVLGISSRTARREWQVARVRLKGSIDGTPAAS